ncbi:MAG: tyrosine-type recombinase/integrase [Prevotella sp.]|nr:tyrosine-type recombinase/integrase [Prevotella sp.]
MKQNVKVVFDRKNQAAKTGTGKIEICVYLNRDERKWETVGSSEEESWEVAAQSRNIQAKVKHYEQIINAMKMLGEDMTIENFNKHVFQAKAPSKPEENVLHNGNDLRQSFVEFCREHLEKEGLAKNSVKDHKVVFNAVEESGILNTFADLTKANVIAFDAWLRRQNNKSDYTINGYHKKVRKYTKILWRLEMISSDPYEYVRFPKGSNKERVPLVEDELVKIRQAECSGRIDRARDLFVFMAYTGLAYCDMAVFNYGTMTEAHTDYTYIDGSRLKTGSNFFTPILPPAMDVLKKYNYKLPVISNQKINDYLDILRERLGINKKVTCHIARHSFATLILSYDMPIENLKRMLGHKNITTTQIYGKILKANVEKNVTMKLKGLR